MRSYCAGSTPRLEIRPLGGRDSGLLIRVVLRIRIVVLDVLGADALVPFLVAGAQVGDGRLPGRREGASILHGEFELQSLALVIGIGRIGGDARPLLVGAGLRFLSGFVI